MVRVTGLEPVRRGHTPLKRACLPVPAHSRRPKYNIITVAICQQEIYKINKIFQKLIYYIKYDLTVFQASIRSSVFHPAFAGDVDGTYTALLPISFKI